MKHPLRGLGMGVAVLSAALLGTCSLAQSKDSKPRVAVFMHDGFAIDGFVKRESADVEIDPYQGIPITFAKGFYLIDDGPRRIVFAQTQVGHVDTQKGFSEERLGRKTRFTGKAATVPDILQVLPDSSAFNQDWERNFHFRGKDQARKPVEYTVKQQIGMLTPYSMRLDTTQFFNFSSAYLTREFPPEVIQSLLASHPNFVENPNMEAEERLKRRFAFAEFLAQAGFFEPAEELLQRTLKEQPTQKTAIDTRLKALGEIKAREDFEEIKRLALAGQHRRVIQRIDNFPTQYASEEMQSKLRELKSDYETAAEHGKEALKYLEELAPLVAHEQKALFQEAAEQMRAELCIDNVNRLDTFLGQMTQYKNQREKGQKTEIGPKELLALAMSSWLLGSAAGETNPETALRLWKTRQLILQYEKSDDVNLRQKMAAAAMKDRPDQAAVEEAAQIIPNLPPVEAAEIDTKIQEVKAGANAVYQVQLPPEYRHGRHYPVLIVLHESGEKPRDMLDRWRSAAAERGYILVAPEWENRGVGFTYTEQDQQVIPDTLRDLRRKYRVDSDRVFLFGLRDGGMMAMDAALSHPDLFAGVSTMGAGPDQYSKIYWHNAQFLPFYVVNGDRVGAIANDTREQFLHWVDKHYPSLWVQYKGRGSEWFGGEVPMIFEWMRVKRRAFPLTQLGKDGGGTPFGTEFFTERPSDNSFYWLTTDEIQRICCNGTGMNFRYGVAPAQLQAMIYPESNDIRVKAVGVKQVTVWLGRNLRGESMIDFSKPVSFRVNSKQVLTKETVKPSLAVMLEDLYRRGDRHRVFLAKLDAVP